MLSILYYAELSHETDKRCTVERQDDGSVTDIAHDGEYYDSSGTGLGSHVSHYYYRTYVAC